MTIDPGAYQVREPDLPENALEASTKVVENFVPRRLLGLERSHLVSSALDITLRISCADHKVVEPCAL